MGRGYNDSANAEFKSAEAALPPLAWRIIQATHGLKSKCPVGALPFLRTWYNDSAVAGFFQKYGKKKESFMKRVGIVGCGGIAGVHASVLKQMEQVELCAFADCEGSKAKSFANKYAREKAGAYESLEELLAEASPDVIHICTPHYLHVPMAVECLEKGCNVFMEKPPAISVEQFAILEQVVEKSNGVLGICLQNRYNQSTLKVDELLRGGNLGEILGARAFVTWDREASYYTESGWRGTWDKEGGGALINQAIHTLDLVLRWLGTPVRVEASMSNHHLRDIIQVEDTVEAFLEFEKGKKAVLFATTAYTANPHALIELACEKGYVRLEGERVWLRYHDGAEVNYNMSGQETLGKTYWGTGHAACIADFYRCLEDKKRYGNDLCSVQNTFQVMTEIYKEAMKEWNR